MFVGIVLLPLGYMGWGSELLLGEVQCANLDALYSLLKELSALVVPESPAGVQVLRGFRSPAAVTYEEMSWEADEDDY